MTANRQGGNSSTYCKKYANMGEEVNMAKYYSEQSRKSAQKYMLKNSYSVAFRLSKVYEKDLIDIYHSIPASQKAAWFKECLREYAEKHPTVERSEGEVSEKEN